MHENVRPILLIMAAGMGSRYGGLKQVDPVTDKNEIIMDFSLYDARMVGICRHTIVPIHRTYNTKNEL